MKCSKSVQLSGWHQAGFEEKNICFKIETCGRNKGLLVLCFFKTLALLGKKHQLFCLVILMGFPQVGNVQIK